MGEEYVDAHMENNLILVINKNIWCHFKKEEKYWTSSNVRFLLFSNTFNKKNCQ